MFVNAIYILESLTKLPSKYHILSVESKYIERDVNYFLLNSYNMLINSAYQDNKLK